ncbi:MAG: DUF4203 domain-containing protein [Dermatophilaceae bacterium]
MTGWAAVVIGLVLCFAGIASTHLAVLLSGFGLAWLLADAFGASTGTTIIISLAGALVAWVVVTLIFRTSLFFVGAAVGTVIGAKLYGVLAGSSNSVIVAVVFVAAVAFICGWMANRWHARVVLWLTAIGGAALALTGLGRIWADPMHALSSPQTTTETSISVVAWVLLTLAGWWSQRRISARALDKRA